MQNTRITKGYLRLRSGIALAILLCASLGAFYVSLSGQRHLMHGATTTRVIERVMVTLADFAMTFDAIRRDPTSQRAKRSEARLQHGVLVGREAIDALELSAAKHVHSQDAHRILTQDVVNPIDEFRDILDIVQLSVEPNRSVQQKIRAATLGNELSRQLIPVFVQLAEAEAEATEEIAQQQKFNSLIAIAIGALGIFVAARFVHLPMERFVISATREIERNQRKAVAASAAKTAFLATMSHEIRTPLNGVMGLSELLQEGERDPSRRRMLDMIVSSGTALLQIINDVLDLSKIEAGKYQIDTEAFDVKALCSEVVELFEAPAHAKGLALTLDVASTDSNWRMKGAGKAVRQVALNLVNNAIKFTDQGAVKVTLSFADDANASAPNTQKRVRISVSDTGIGISEAAMGHIFDRFVQADSSTTTRYGGTGLGLAIAQQLTEAMGGQIAASSVEGQGASFTLEFPVEMMPPAVLDTAVKTAAKERFEGKVLVADDNHVNLVVAERMLMNLGCTVKVAKNGIEAVEMQRTWSPDLILMDVRMPEMDGLEATQLLRAENAQGQQGRVAIVGLSANAMAEHQAGGVSAGMDGYLTKPLKRAALVAELRKHLTPVVVTTKEARAICA